MKSPVSVSTLSASYASALLAAQHACAHQNYPKGTLYMVATPIGNLADISLRALYMLQFADILACEDTRHTQALLHAYGIDRSHAPMLAVHQHNEVECAQQVQELLGLGLRVAYVSDAGTPAISDPGARLVATLRAAHFPVVPLPGACSVTAALSVAGIAPGTTQQGAFVFAGFLPHKTSERTAAIEALVSEVRTVVLLEAPHRIETLATALASLGDRLITVGRELTKQFEEIATLQAKDFAGWLAQDGHRLLGEFTLVLHPTSVPDMPPNLRVLKLLLDQLPLKTAVKLAAQLTGEPRNSLYALALSLKAGAGSKDLISG